MTQIYEEVSPTEIIRTMFRAMQKRNKDEYDKFWLPGASKFVIIAARSYDIEKQDILQIIFLPDDIKIELKEIKVLGVEEDIACLQINWIMWNEHAKSQHMTIYTLIWEDTWKIANVIESVREFATMDSGIIQDYVTDLFHEQRQTEVLHLNYSGHEIAISKKVDSTKMLVDIRKTDFSISERKTLDQILLEEGFEEFNETLIMPTVEQAISLVYSIFKRCFNSSECSFIELVRKKK